MLFFNFKIVLIYLKNTKGKKSTLFLFGRPYMYMVKKLKIPKVHFQTLKAEFIAVLGGIKQSHKTKYINRRQQLKIINNMVSIDVKNK